MKDCKVQRKKERMNATMKKKQNIFSEKKDSKEKRYQMFKV